MWDSHPGCPKAGKMPALQNLDVIKSSFLRVKDWHYIYLLEGAFGIGPYLL
jgi:hypothetical protein